MCSRKQNAFYSVNLYSAHDCALCICAVTYSICIEVVYVYNFVFIFHSLQQDQHVGMGDIGVAFTKSPTVFYKEESVLLQRQGRKNPSSQTHTGLAGNPHKPILTKGVKSVQGIDKVHYTMSMVVSMIVCVCLFTVTDDTYAEQSENHMKYEHMKYIFCLCSR